MLNESNPNAAASVSVVPESFLIDASDSFHLFLCPICHNVFANPVVAACGHSFCSNCLNKENENYKCPVDSQVTMAPNWICPPNSILASLIKKFAQQRILQLCLCIISKKTKGLLCHVVSIAEIKSL